MLSNRVVLWFVPNQTRGGTNATWYLVWWNRDRLAGISTRDLVCVRRSLRSQQSLNRVSRQYPEVRMSTTSLSKRAGRADEVEAKVDVKRRRVEEFGETLSKLYGCGISVWMNITINIVGSIFF